MPKRPVITVDGLAGTGKTTLSRLLAGKLGFAHLNSGELYRAVALLALRHGVDVDDAGALCTLLHRHEISLSSAGGEIGIFIDGDEVGDQIRTPKVSEATSLASRHAEVRRKLTAAQRGAFPGLGVVAEGRDMGTVIFPDAEVKFFVIADAEVRVRRRIEQLYGDIREIGPDQLSSLMNEMKREVVDRDRRDAERAVSPTRPAVGAISIDNSVEKLTQVVQTMYDSAVQKGIRPDTD